MIKYRIRSVERTGNGLNQVKTKCSVVKVKVYLFTFSNAELLVIEACI